jgi:hypothetical protein
MSLTQGLQLPFGIQPVNPVPVDSWSGPYEGTSLQDVINLANSNIPIGIRFQSMEVRLIVGGVSKKYWYRDGINDTDLVDSGLGTIGGPGDFTFNPSDYDLDEFNNNNADPFAHISDLPAYSNFIEDSITDGVTDKAPTENAVFDALELKQNSLGYTPVNSAGDTMLGDLILHQDPSNALGAATKQYVDNVVTGINFHPPVRVATTENIVANYNNGEDGVGATLTGLSPGYLYADGITVEYLDRILVCQQTEPTENGVYEVTIAGGEFAIFELTRATDADNNPTGEIHYGDYILVLSGTSNAGFGFICNTPGTVSVGLTPINYVQFNAAQAVTAGYGLKEITSNIIEIDTTVTQEKIILTTTGSYGPATFINNELNIPAFTSNSSFYIQGGTSYSFDTTSNIYRTGSLNIGSGTATDGRFVVSSTGGTVSLVVDNNGNVYNNSKGSTNTLFGYRALYSNTAMGYSNTAFGRLTLYSNIDGNSNTAVGLSSLYGNTYGNYNTAVGLSSLYFNTTGDMNTSIGAYSLSYNTLGNYNTAMGYNVLYNTTTTVSVLGTFSAGNGYTTGTYSDIQLIYATGSTALGYPSATIVVGVGGTISSVTLSTGNKGRGFKDTTTILTAATSSIGNGTGFTIGVSTILSGSTNTSIGHQSLYTNTSGSENVAIGFNSLFSNSTSSKNVAVGRNTLYYNSTGGNNTAIGYYSSFNNTTGDNNTALGYQSLYNAAVSSNNTAIGYQSLYSIIGDSSNNTAIGYHAGHYITSGIVSATLSNWSTYIGSYTRGYAYDTTHEVVIGASAIGNGSYSVTLGNDSITKTILKGNIGIGTASPSATSKISIDLGTFSSTKDGISIDGSCGNNPGYTGVRFSLLNTTANASGSIRMYRATGTTYLGMIITSQSRDGILFNTGTITPTERMIITSDGNVGIGTGTASPSTKLHIYATQSGAFRLEDGTQGTGKVLISDSNGVGTWTNSIQTQLDTKLTAATGTINYLQKVNGVNSLGNSSIFDNGTYIGINTIYTATKDITLGNQADREIGVEISDSYTVGRDLMLSAGKAINYGIAEFVPFSVPLVGLSIFTINKTTLDIYAISSNGSVMYKKPAGSTDFVTHAITNAYTSGISVNYTTNDIWVISGSTIQKQTGGSGLFSTYSTTGLPASTGINSIFVNPVTNDIWVVLAGVSLTGKLYKQTGGTGPFAEYTCNIAFNAGKVIVNPITNDIFIADPSSYAGGKLIKQTGGSGLFTTVLATTVKDIDVDYTSGTIYVIAGYNSPANGIHKQTNGTGGFVLQGVLYGSGDSYNINTGFNTLCVEPTTLNVLANFTMNYGGTNRIYKQINYAPGTDNLQGGTLKLYSGTGKGTGTSDIEMWTGNATTSGTDMQTTTLRAKIDNTGLMTLPSVTNTLIDTDTTGKSVVTKEYVNNRLVSEKATDYTLQDSDSGGIIIFTTSATCSIPTGLTAGFECTFVTLAGATLTVSPGSNTLYNNVSTVMLPQLSFTLKRRIADNSFIATGNL